MANGPIGLARWWGDTPPYHCPVFVLTHHAHDPIEMKGGTTFHFVTDGIESAYAQAKAAAGDRDISIAGGASCARQAINAGLVDEIDLQSHAGILGSANACSTASRPASPSWSSSACCTPPAWPTSATTSASTRHNT